MPRLLTRYWIPVFLAICFTTSLLLRILPPYDRIFTDLGVKFALNDAYYHMRVIDNLASNFPHFSYYDPYFVFPGTTVIGGTHFFDWLASSIIWLVGLGSPTQVTIDTVGAYLPPILAALLIIPVYFIGKTVFNKWVGVAAAFLVAILPGEFLGRSILGAADHHVAEVLFSTTAIMFFILAIKAPTTRRTRVFTILAGVSLGVYLLTWLGGLLFILIICLFLVIQTISNHLRGESSTRLASITTAVLAIATFMNLSGELPREILLALVLSIILPTILAGSSWLILKRQWHPAVFPVAIIGAGIAFLLSINWLYPSFTSYLGMFLPSGSTATTTLELQPMLFPRGQFTWSVLWGTFTTVSILAPAAFAFIVVSVVRDKGKDSGKVLLVIWSLVTITLMLNQRRYAYYAVVNMSLLSAYLVYIVTSYFAWAKTYCKTGKRNKGRSKAVRRLSPTRIGIAAIVAVLVLAPTNLSGALQTARAATFTPSNAWQSAMVWMRDNTPEPFGEDLYSSHVALSKKNEPPTPDYTVSAWWDYGYWITRIGHRVPNANPAQNAEAIERVASLLLSTGDDYQEQVNALRSQYIVVDNSVAFGKFYAVASWGSKDNSEYFGVYRVPDSDGYRNLMLFYPEYYETLVSRLYNFNGEAAVPERIIVITYRDNTVLDVIEFTDYREALEYVDSTPGTRIVSADPTISPIPLDEMDYELVYNSAERVNNMPDVKIFEYTSRKGE